MYPPVSQHLVQESDRLQDEIRQLERDLNTLSHKSSTLSESCRRDCSEVEVFRRETLRVEADLREWKARDATVAASVVASQDSGRLLAGMETQTRVGLDQEVKRTRDQRAQMEGTVVGAKLQVRQVEERMMGIEDFAQVKELEKKVRSGRQELEDKMRRSGGAGSRGDQLRDDRNKWDLVKKAVLDTAEAWKGKEFATKAVMEEGKALDLLNRRAARMREAARQEEMRRKTEQEGWARLDKVSTEVGRMERVLGCRTIHQRGDMLMESERGSMEGGCGEERIKDFSKGGNQRKGGNAQTIGNDCSQAQRSDMGVREHGSSSTSTSSLSSYVPPTPRTLNLQLNLSTSMLKRSSSNKQVAEGAYGRSIQPDASNVADDVAPHVQANWSLQQSRSLLGGDEPKQESSQLSAGNLQRQAPTPRLWRLPLPKLKSLIRPWSTPEGSTTRTDFEESSPAQMPQQKVAHTPTTSSNSATSEQELRGSSEASPCTHADSENKFGNDKLVRKSVPKLNLFGSRTRTQDKDSVDGQSQLPAVSGKVTCDSNQVVHAQQRSQQWEDKVAAQGIPSEQQQAHPVWENESHVDVPQSHAYNQQACATVSTEAGQQLADQDCGKESDLEEGEFYDADGNNDTAVECGHEVEEGQLEVKEGEITEASLPATSSTPASPRITPGKRRLPPLKLSPGTALNDSKREAAFQDLLDGISQEQAAVPSLPKAPRLQLSSATLPSEGKSLTESHVSPYKQTNGAISFNLADLEQGGSKQVTTPPASSSAIPVGNESSSANKNLFGGEDVGGFGFSFGADDTCDTEQSFSFFGGGGCKSPEQEEKEGGFFLNLGGGGDGKMEEESGWNLFGQ